MNLWKDKVVYALVTASKNGKGIRRLFLCLVDPESISFDWENNTNKTIYSYGTENLFLSATGLVWFEVEH